MKFVCGIVVIIIKFVGVLDLFLFLFLFHFISLIIIIDNKLLYVVTCLHSLKCSSVYKLQSIFKCGELEAN